MEGEGEGAGAVGKSGAVVNTMPRVSESDSASRTEVRCRYV